ncbi:aminoacetone oxidase family FAD-binding enzyme [Planktotalea sp.]|uniref:NAD(P)/FAD-dependent oxidoreductase n=1 Tax=Planktotalea sp. TaxID=2029877 RepID=UPI0025E845C8|nr:aminoacetone oxidase family FAD-binding enzyme [Planktotalea sp.]
MDYDTIIVGAGAAGMMCAAHTGGRTLVIDHAKTAGEKIRISGGGHCNFTNLGTLPENFISKNPHFCKSALKRYTQWDFLDLVGKHQIAWHEKTLGQLFCDVSAKQIVAMLLQEMADADAELWLNSSAGRVTHDGERFLISAKRDGTQVSLTSRNLVLASGGKSIPKMGATGFAYDIGQQFGLAMVETRPALVPLTFVDQRYAPISGVSAPARACANGVTFEEAVLFTHRGLSGPAILQASSYWKEGDDVVLDLDPDRTLFEALRVARQEQGKRDVATVLAQQYPTRLTQHIVSEMNIDGRIGDQSDKALEATCSKLQNWVQRPTGSEGYRTAEVTLGGIDTDGVSSKTMETKTKNGLYVIGEALDVTGWLGGYNFQWAWSSGWAAGTAIAQADA